MPQLHETAQKILDTMALMDRPASIKQIADEMQVVDQTVRNHMPKLVEMGYVGVYQRRIAGATGYVLIKGGSRTVVPISWVGGEVASIREIFEKIGKDGALSTNPFWAALQKVIVELYKTSIMSIDDDNPQPISLIELKQYQKALMNLRRECQRINHAATDLLNVKELWSPRELPKVLIISDPDIDIEHMRDIIDRLP